MDQPQPAPGPRWRPLERLERRVVGVLAEKAKTTPDVYPLTLNSIVTGSNQKSNRFPLMTVDAEQAEQALESLRHCGAVALIQGDSRVEKYRHLLYEWLGVDKVELAVMTELLLRGAQTIGELRGRAARMEPIGDVGQLMPIVESLVKKDLVIYLTTPGRGAVVTHNLYQPQELAKVKAEHGGGFAAAVTSTAREPSPSPPPSSPRLAEPPAPPSAGARGVLDEELARFRQDLADFRESTTSELASLRRDLDDLRRQLGG